MIGARFRLALALFIFSNYFYKGSNTAHFVNENKYSRNRSATNRHYRGGGAGLTLARKLARTNFQIVLIDRNNFHQFQPLFYQVAMAGLEPSSIVFPIRKYFRRHSNVFFE